VVRTVVERHGALDVLVNNAASTQRGSLEDSTVEFWDTMIGGQPAGAVHLPAGSREIDEDAGPAARIVNIGSIKRLRRAVEPRPVLGIEGAVMTMTRNAAGAFAQIPVRVNQLNVGWTLTEGEERVQRLDGKGRNGSRTRSPTGPLDACLSPHDIALAAAYFASDDSALITGSVLELEQFPLGLFPE
jgi:NAD(P)-dependent dehydrogenase (short-subunit alcohol dehydrogenase family)